MAEGALAVTGAVGLYVGLELVRLAEKATGAAVLGALALVIHGPEKTMHHIAKRRPEMDGCEMAIKAAVESARDRCHGRKNGERVEGREILFAQNLGDGPWLAVVVAYKGNHGTVLTAYADRRGPREADRI